MANTWIVDLQHYLNPAGAIAQDMPNRARLLAEYFASIVVDATTNIDDAPTVRCRWPAHRRCVGIVMSYPAADPEDSIYWHCPVCGDNGVIRGWQNTFWDGFAAEGISTPVS